MCDARNQTEYYYQLKIREKDISVLILATEVVPGNSSFQASWSILKCFAESRFSYTHDYFSWFFKRTAETYLFLGILGRVQKHDYCKNMRGGIHRVWLAQDWEVISWTKWPNLSCLCLLQHPPLFDKTSATLHHSCLQNRALTVATHMHINRYKVRPAVI